MAKINCLPDKQVIDIDPSQTILEALLEADISHTHVCGGHAYCSTCRVMILDGIHHCSPPTNAEKALAKQLEFPFHVRLACQTRVSGDISIRRMVLDNEDLDFVENQFSSNAIGSRKTVAVLFATIRGGSMFDEENFHYDMVYILTRYFHRMHKVVNQYGGVINSQMGPWLLAVFGLEDMDRVAERAVWAGLDMLQAIKALNESLEKLSYQPLQLNLGIHYGPAVLIASNPAQPTMLHPVGDVVNWVSRIEAANRELGSELLVSEAVYNLLLNQLVVNRATTIQVPGKNFAFKVYEVSQIQGTAPARVLKPEASEPLTKRVLSFVQKFAGSWGKSS